MQKSRCSVGLQSMGASDVFAPSHFGLDTDAILSGVDGLLMQGGVDMSPVSYGEEPISELWPGDRERDIYEINLVKRALERQIPVLAVCRGVQVLNVALGGSLFQDLATQVPNAREHRNAEMYDALHHDIDLLSGGRLQALYGGAERVRVNSVHHQGLKRVADELTVEAVSVEDDIIEGVSLSSGASWCIGCNGTLNLSTNAFPTSLIEVL